MTVVVLRIDWRSWDNLVEVYHCEAAAHRRLIDIANEEGYEGDDFHEACEHMNDREHSVWIDECEVQS